MNLSSTAEQSARGERPGVGRNSRQDLDADEEARKKFYKQSPRSSATLVAQHARPWRILSLDGGGVRGLAELLMLERLMRTIRDQQDLPYDVELKPCEYFDLIAGTSTGGLIALMLGRLRMTVPEAIKHFKFISPRIFPGKRPGPFAKVYKAEIGRPFFDGENMTTAIKELLRDEPWKEPEMDLRDLSNTTCKVFVVSTTKANASKLLLRSYYIRSSTQTNYECRVWQAARATSAAPLYFAPFTLERPGQIKLVLCDGGLNTDTINNPIYEVMSEAYRLDPHREIGCVVSLGTGRIDAPTIGSKGHQVAMDCVAIATGCHEKSEQYIQGSEGQALFQADRYFRFDPARRVGAIALEDWRKLDDMETSVGEYLSSNAVGRNIDRCAERLWESSAVKSGRPTSKASTFHRKSDEQSDDLGLSEPNHRDSKEWSISKQQRSSSGFKSAQPCCEDSDNYNDIDACIYSAFRKLGESAQARDAFTEFNKAHDLFKRHERHERQSSNRLVTILLGMAYCHHQKAAYQNKDFHRRRQNLESANTYIQQAAEVKPQNDYDRLRVEFYQILHQLNGVDILKDLDNLTTQEKVNFQRQLNDFRQRFRESRLREFQPLTAVYESQIARKLERL